MVITILAQFERLVKSITTFFIIMNTFGLKIIGMKDFIKWLIDEMEKRGWSNSDLSRRAEVVPSNISLVINGHQKPGHEFCIKIARAFGYPPERVLREAGLLPPAPSEDDPEFRELVEIARNLTTQERKNALEYLLWRYKLQTERATRRKTSESEEDQ